MKLKIPNWMNSIANDALLNNKDAAAIFGMNDHNFHRDIKARYGLEPVHTGRVKANRVRAVGWKMGEIRALVDKINESQIK